MKIKKTEIVFLAETVYHNQGKKQSKKAGPEAGSHW